MKKILFLFVGLLALTASGCASHETKSAFSASNNDEDIVAFLDNQDAYLESETYAAQIISDPLEGWNRSIFYINDGIITFVVRPVHGTYTALTHEDVRTGIGNVFTNLLFPVRFVNNLLQGKGREAGQEFGKFIINSTAGLGGFINYTGLNHPELAKLDSEDFGQTLGIWGLGEGCYLYWPFLGPSSARDTVGAIGDWAADPLTWLRPNWVTWPVKGLRTINELDSLLDVYDTVTKSAIEPYTAVRDAYIQYRRAKIEK